MTLKQHQPEQLACLGCLISKTHFSDLANRSTMYVFVNTQRENTLGSQVCDVGVTTGLIAGSMSTSYL